MTEAHTIERWEIEDALKLAAQLAPPELRHGKRVLLLRRTSSERQQDELDLELTGALGILAAVVREVEALADDYDGIGDGDVGGRCVMLPKLLAALRGGP